MVRFIPPMYPSSFPFPFLQNFILEVNIAHPTRTLHECNQHFQLAETHEGEKLPHRPSQPNVLCIDVACILWDKVRTSVLVLGRKLSDSDSC